jgi:hypothetical protein
MSNPSLFFAIAGISMSFAGFAGLFVALRPHGTEWQRHEVGQLSGIILFALTALFGALLVVPLASLIGESTAIRVLSAAVLGLAFYLHQVRVGTSWLRWSQVRGIVSRQEQVGRVAFASVAIAEQTLLLVNVLFPSQELYELALIMMLATPALVFVWLVTQMGSSTGR